MEHWILYLFTSATDPAPVPVASFEKFDVCYQAKWNIAIQAYKAYSGWIPPSRITEPNIVAPLRFKCIQSKQPLTLEAMRSALEAQPPSANREQ